MVSRKVVVVLTFAAVWIVAGLAAWRLLARARPLPSVAGTASTQTSGPASTIPSAPTPADIERLRAAEAARAASEAAERRRLTEASRAAQQRADDDARRAAAAAGEAERQRIAAEEAQRLAQQRSARVEAPQPLPAAIATPPPCSVERTCAAVTVFFGTDRRENAGRQRIDFGPERANQLKLGRATVTVPRATKRAVGEIPVPGALDKVLQAVGLKSALSDPTKHFTVLPNGVTVFRSEPEFLAAVQAHAVDAGEFRKHAFVFVHGYNTTFEFGLFRVAQIAYDLAGPDGKPFGLPFLYSWPSAGTTKDYLYDAESAQFAARHLRTFLEMVIDRSGAEQVHLIAHSMGTRPLLAALDEMARPSDRPVVLEPVPRGARPAPKATPTPVAPAPAATARASRINQIVLAAADFDAAQFAEVGRRITRLAKGVTLYASANDRALQVAREAHKGLPRAGDVPTTGPVIVAGIDTIDVSAVSTDILATGHSQYAEKRELLNDLALLLRRGERPPHQRTPLLKTIPAGNTVFWRMQ